MFTALLALLLMAWPAPALAADTVQVTLPSFSVTLNGQTNGNQYSKYPLIVYKDITYFPMTYYDCRLLGLKTNWTAGTGLVIDKNEDYFYEYRREVTSSRNSPVQTAKLADGKITVNGKVIDNSKEEYPLLVFRDVTYFPLTWRFAVNEFGWDYRFDKQAGLVIGNDKVKLENPEEWKITEFWFGQRSSDSGQLYLGEITKDTISNDKNSELIRIYNATNKDIHIEKLDGLEYRIYQKLGNREELLYRFLVPVFSGKINKSYFYEYVLNLNFWENAPKGNYIVELKHNNSCSYQDLATGEWHTQELTGEGIDSYKYCYKSTVVRI